MKIFLVIVFMLVMMVGLGVTAAENWEAAKNGEAVGTTKDPVQKILGSISSAADVVTSKIGSLGKDVGNKATQINSGVEDGGWHTQIHSDRDGGYTIVRDLSHLNIEAENKTP